MLRKNNGHYETTKFGNEEVRAFVPRRLPPDPEIAHSTELDLIHEKAAVSIGCLDGLSTLLPDPGIFIYSYVRKEALLSSQIEGTQSTLTDLLSFELEGSEGSNVDDIKEVSNYVSALYYGLARVRAGFPISTRLIKEIHEKLLTSGRGAAKQPGEFRTSQNWIGGSRPGKALFVPPPHNEVAACMSDLEKFIHDQPRSYPTLIKAALAHVQFETIHPFLDGNGRLGRLLVTLLVCVVGLLREPLLYLSLYLKEHRDEYYTLLQEVRTDGDWEKWLIFFLKGVDQTATSAVDTAKSLLTIFRKDKERIDELGRLSQAALRVHNVFERKPIASAKQVCLESSLSPATVNKAIDQLQQLSIVREITGRKRNRLYSYTAYLDELNKGTAPL